MSWMQSMGTDELDRRFAAAAPSDADEPEAEPDATFRRELLSGSAELRAALEMLPPVEQDIIQYCVLQRKTQADVASLLGVSQPSVSWRLHRAMDRLRHLLTRPHPTRAEAEAAMAAANIMGDDAETARAFLRSTGISATAQELHVSEGCVRGRLSRILEALEAGPPEAVALANYMRQVPLEILAGRYGKAWGTAPHPSSNGKGTIAIRVKLEVAGIVERAIALARIQGERASQDAEFAELAKAHRRARRALLEEEARLSQAIRDGYDEDRVPVREEPDAARGVVVVRHAETGELLEEREMTAEERQVELFEG